MSTIIYIAVLPVIFLLLLIYDKDKNKEPKALLKKLFIWGLISFVPIAIFEVILSLFFDVESKNLLWLFISVFFNIALIEELFKWLVVRKFAYNSREFDEVYDAIVYSVCASLGFACLENILYVLEYGLKVGFYRAFTAIPVHTCNGILMGYYLGLAKKNKNDKKYMILSLVMPILAHTLYDFLIMAKSKRLLFWWFVSYIAFVIVCVKIVNKVSKNNERIGDDKTVVYVNPFLKDVDFNYCGNCGKPCKTKYCTECGYQNKKD